MQTHDKMNAYLWEWVWFSFIKKKELFIFSCQSVCFWEDTLQYNEFQIDMILIWYVLDKPW